MMQIAAFRQHEKGIEVQICSDLGRIAHAKYLPVVPDIIQINRLEHYRNLTISESAGSTLTSINFPETEPDSHEYSIILLDTRQENYLEIVRQSEAYLDKRFGFRRVGGCCIAGRRNILLGQDVKIQKGSTKVFYGRAGFPIVTGNYKKSGGSDEIHVAKEILEWLYSRKLNTGPVGKNHKRYQIASFSRKIKMLQRGDYSVQCGTFRDLFVHIALNRGLIIRIVSGENYSPQYSCLSTYSHALCEIWVSKLRKYVIFDPWFGGLMVNEKDSPISAERLNAISRKSVNLRLTTEFPEMERLIIDGAGKQLWYTFKNSDISLKDYLFNKKIGGCMPGYIEYFRHVTIHNTKQMNRIFLYISIIHRAVNWIFRQIKSFF
jgi:hypothetical protein